MKTSSLFVVGLVVGALAVFLIRATTLSERSPGAGTHATPAAPPPHEGHADHDGTMGMRAEPAPAPAPAPAPEAEHAGHDAADATQAPENLICPVMGNEVDPRVFVDYRGRRIGFCCPGCDELFLKDPERYLKKVDAELAARKGAK